MTAGAAFPPPGYLRWRQGPHDVVAAESVAGAVRDALGEAPSLSGWAAARAERRKAATGRGVVHVARLGTTLAAVRHYNRGGWMAPLLGDRYLDRRPRPFAELEASERLRGAGVETPRVLAAVVTHARLGHRADLATEWLEGGHDLTALLLPGTYPDVERGTALEAAGRVVAGAHAAGLDHADLNLTNLFVSRDANGWRAAILDLDRARFRDSAGAEYKKKTSPGSSGLFARPVARAA